ncbi:MAG: response regulator receiver protein [Firmicutes bacterium]|nr:response regulator receiver protein [Bacillota bacterium]
MKILIAEDDRISRTFMEKFLSAYGECDVAVNGLEAVDAYLAALKKADPYQLICLDIMMPKLDGLKVLKTIREIEKQQNIGDKSRVKIIMTTAINDSYTVLSAYDSGCEAYAWKPIEREKFILVLKKLGLID